MNPKFKTSQTYKVFTPTSYDNVKQNELSQANPYANVSYRQSWIQNLLEKIGFRTNKDAYLESMALQAKEYDNQIAQKIYNEQYDDPLQQANRERLAGLNPDLTGNVSAGETPGPVDDGNPPVAPVADDLNIVQGFASAVLNGVQAAFGIAGDIQSLKSLQLGNESRTMSLVKDAFGMIIPDLYSGDSDSRTGEVSFRTYYDKLKPIYGNTMSRRRFDNFVRRVNSFANSAEGRSMVYATQSNKAKNRKSMFSEIADPDQYSEWDDIMFTIADELSSLAFDVNKKSLENQKYYQNNVAPEELANKEMYEQAFDPTTAAKIASNPDELSLTENAREMSDYNRSLRSSFKSIMDKLDSLGDKGNKVAPIVKAVLSVWLMGMMPSIPFPHGSKTITSGPKGVSETRSTSW